MKLNPNAYRVSLDKMRLQILDNKGDAHFRCAELSAVSGVPALAVVLYALRPEVLGESRELRHAALALTEFYKYDEVAEWEDR